MFTLRFWDAFGLHGMSCVKLPAAVSFPTDDRLLKRIEESRRALPANNVKPLWKSRELARATEAPSAPTQPIINVSLAAVDRRPARGEPRSIAAQSAPVADIELEAELREHWEDAESCVVPLARMAGPHGRARDGINVSAA
jgi:hypothetical protein